VSLALIDAVHDQTRIVDLKHCSSNRGKASGTFSASVGRAQFTSTYQRVFQLSVAAKSLAYPYFTFSFAL